MSAEPLSYKDVIIIGAGIGGLTLAHALIQQGLSVQILERAPALEKIGAGIQVPPNAMKVLRAIDLDGLIKSHAFQPVAIQARMGRSGRSVFDIPLAHAAENRWGAPYLHIHRADYISALSGQLPGGVLHLNCCVMGYDNTDDGVSVTLKDGQTLWCRYLVGADGIRSSTRAQMLGPDAPRFTGNMAWRAVVPTAELGEFAPAPTACAWFGPKRHAVTYRLGADGDLTNFVGVVEQDSWQAEGWSIPGERQDVLADFQGWHPIIQMILKKAVHFHRWALFDRLPLERWVDGRVVLLGDAAHPMLPFLAQGAAMAVEDAWVLAETLSGEGDLLAYQNQRLDRTSKVQAASRKNMGLFHKSSLFSQLGTYGPMWLAGKLDPNIVHRRMDWLYGHDVTAE